MLSSLNTNSKSIEELTNATTLSDSDRIEISGDKSATLVALAHKIITHLPNHINDAALLCRGTMTIAQLKETVFDLDPQPDGIYTVPGSDDDETSGIVLQTGSIYETIQILFSHNNIVSVSGVTGNRPYMFVRRHEHNAENWGAWTCVALDNIQPRLGNSQDTYIGQNSVKLTGAGKQWLFIQMWIKFGGSTMITGNDTDDNLEVAYMHPDSTDIMTFDQALTFYLQNNTGGSTPTEGFVEQLIKDICDSLHDNSPYGLQDKLASGGLAARSDFAMKLASNTEMQNIAQKQGFIEKLASGGLASNSVFHSNLAMNFEFIQKLATGWLPQILASNPSFASELAPGLGSNWDMGYALSRNNGLVDGLSSNSSFASALAVFSGFYGPLARYSGFQHALASGGLLANSTFINCMADSPLVSNETFINRLATGGLARNSYFIEQLATGGLEMNTTFAARLGMSSILHGNLAYSMNFVQTLCMTSIFAKALLANEGFIIGLKSELAEAASVSEDNTENQAAE